METIIFDESAGAGAAVYSDGFSLGDGMGRMPDGTARVSEVEYCPARRLWVSRVFGRFLSPPQGDDLEICSGEVRADVVGEEHRIIEDMIVEGTILIPFEKK